MTGSQGIKNILGMSHVDSTAFPFEPILRVRGGCVFPWAGTNGYKRL